MFHGEKRIRHAFLLPESLSMKLQILTERPGSSKTQIVIDALADFLDRDAQPEIDTRYAIRLDRMSAQLARLERRMHFVSEALGLFIQHQLTSTAHDAPFEAATAHLGRRRYEAFLQLVWKRMSSNREGRDMPPEASDEAAVAQGDPGSRAGT